MQAQGLHLLIIRPGAIGDALLALPIIQALRFYHGYVYVRLATNRAILPLARASRLVDEAFDYDDMRWSQLFSTNFDQLDMLDLLGVSNTAICWLRDPDGLVRDNLHLMGIGQIIIAPGRPLEHERIHTTTYLARTIGIDPPGPFVFSFSSTRLVTPTAPIAIHPGSGGARKCWPITSFAAVIRALWQRNIPVLLLAGPADHERLATLTSQLDPPPHSDLLEMLVDLPLLELSQHLQRCRGYLGNDSGITHLASMLGLPTLALFGPSDPLIWRPCGPYVQVLHRPELEHLPVEEVIQHLTRFF